MDHKESYEIVSLGPAAARGWRAVYFHEGSGFATVPIQSWGVFHKTVRKEPSGEVVEDLGNVIEGVIANPEGGGPIRGFLCAAGPAFEGYLAPGMQI